jgi:hypothetical protein
MTYSSPYEWSLGSTDSSSMVVLPCSTSRTAGVDRIRDSAAIRQEAVCVRRVRTALPRSLDDGGAVFGRILSARVATTDATLGEVFRTAHKKSKVALEMSSLYRVAFVSRFARDSIRRHCRRSRRHRRRRSRHRRRSARHRQGPPAGRQPAGPPCRRQRSRRRSQC